MSWSSHVSDRLSEVRRQTRAQTRIATIRELCNLLITMCKELYTPTAQVTIDKKKQWKKLLSIDAAGFALQYWIKL